MKNMKKWLVTAVGLAVLLGGIIGLKALQIMDLIGWGTAMQEAGMPPVSVATAVAQEVEWEDALRFVGTLKPVQGVMLAAEVGGTVVAVFAENGAEVRKGQLLLELDTQQERALLETSQAQLRFSKANIERAQNLLEKKIVSVSDYDNAKSEYDANAARVRNLQAIIEKKMIRAPFDGRVGIRKVNLGQSLKAGEELIPLHQSNPIFVDFAVPQTRLGAVVAGQKLRIFSDGLAEPAEGVVVAINPVIDEATRTALVQGLLENPGEKLRAGQFAEVDVLMPEKEKVVVVPATAVLEQAFGSSVFLVESEGDSKFVVRQQFVKVGERRGDFVSILKGLKAGERVVSAGAFKLTNGAKVAPDDAMQPPVSETPAVKNS